MSAAGISDPAAGAAMAEICRSFGVVIRMESGASTTPGFRAEYGAWSADLAIRTLEVSRGRLPHRVLRLVRSWARRHDQELRENWDRVHRGLLSRSIEPFDWASWMESRR
jgi:hypothetical protein